MRAIPKEDIGPAETGRVIDFNANKARLDLFNLLYDIPMLVHHLPDFRFRRQLITGEIMVAIVQDNLIVGSAKKLRLRFQNPNPCAEN